MWISNSFSNDGVTVVRSDVLRGAGDPLEDALTGANGFDIPQDVLDFNATLRNDGAVNAIDPDFDVPSQFRWNLGIIRALPWDVELTADFLYSRVNDEVLWQDLRLQEVGTAPDGRPIYAPRADGRVNPSLQDLLLTNTSQGESAVFTIEASKTWRTAAGRFDANLGYGNQDVKDVNPGTSSTASSNWDNVAVSDPNDPGLGTSNYEIEHRFSRHVPVDASRFSAVTRQALRSSVNAARDARTATLSVPTRRSGATRARARASASCSMCRTAT